MRFETVSVIGLGYIGLPTAAILANHGVKVVGVDINSNTVATINGGGVHIVEPDLDAMVRAAVQSGSLRASTRPEAADAFIIAVPTPFKGDHEPDLACVEAAVRSIAPVLKKGALVILESTSPVGTTEQMAQWLASERPDLSFPTRAGQAADVKIAYCPERVLPGRILQELSENDRVVGGLTSTCAEAASALYRTFVRGQCITTDARTAEMCKLTENSFRDVNIAFANELSLICDELNINVWELIRLANHHPRVNILQPGPGVGGHCIAVDPWFIVHKSPHTARLIRTAREVNDSKPYAIVQKVKATIARQPNASIACLGLAFKADVDDLRESPAVEIVQHLKELNFGTLYVAEPYIDELPENLTARNIVLVDAKEAVSRADIVLLLVNHKLFSSIGAADIVGKVVIDTRGMWDRVS